jgi:hypothetical protein
MIALYHDEPVRIKDSKNRHGNGIARDESVGIVREVKFHRTFSSQAPVAPPLFSSVEPTPAAVARPSGLFRAKSGAQLRHKHGVFPVPSFPSRDGNGPQNAECMIPQPFFPIYLRVIRTAPAPFPLQTTSRCTKN